MVGGVSFLLGNPVAAMSFCATASGGNLSMRSRWKTSNGKIQRLHGPDSTLAAWFEQNRVWLLHAKFVLTINSPCAAINSKRGPEPRHGTPELRGAHFHRPMKDQFHVHL